LNNSIEAEARVALNAAQGNGDLAVEFLMNGIPEQLLHQRIGKLYYALLP
jgi:hypothetical protein